MPVLDPGSTSNRPPQIAEAMPSAGAIAARRSEPGVCAVPRSNSSGLTIWMAAGELMRPRIVFEVGSHEIRWALSSEPLNWALRNSLRIETDPKRYPAGVRPKSEGRHVAFEKACAADPIIPA